MAHVLVIEPNRLLAKTYKAFLEEKGFTVAVAVQAQGAIESSDGAKPDVVVLELQLAGHSGIEFMYEFRSYPEWQSIPIIIHTMVPPQNLQPQQALLERLGVAEYLYKPSTSLLKLSRAISAVTEPVLDEAKS